MKTPREILLHHHCQTDRKLAEIQAHVLARPAGSPLAKMPGFIFHKVWTELFHPLRYAWTAFAAIWLMLWFANLQLSDSRPLTMADAKPESSPSIFIVRQEQAAILAELTESALHPVADRPRVTPPKPQSRSATITVIG